MKILYAFQGTGNGHLIRAVEIVPCLMKFGSVDVLISGNHNELGFPLSLQFRKYGLSFSAGKKGGIDYWDSFIKMRPNRFVKDIMELPVENYDLILNDFEPVTAWACRVKRKSCFGIGHQASFVSKKTPRPKKKDFFAEKILASFAPANDYLGFHFAPYDHFIHTPVIKKSIRNAAIVNKGHVTVYLPAYADQLLIDTLSRLPDVPWEVYSRNCHKVETYKNITLFPVTIDAFNNSMITADGILCGAGFETPAEALFLKKKLMVIPMKGQYEQQCNAEALQRLGVKSVHAIEDGFVEALDAWIHHSHPLHMDFPDITLPLLEKIIRQKAPPSMQLHTYDSGKILG